MTETNLESYGSAQARTARGTPGRRGKRGSDAVSYVGSGARPPIMSAFSL